MAEVIVEEVSPWADMGTWLDSSERIASMSRQEVDELPYGFIVLDEQGTILLYNRYEARMSRLDPSRVIGKNFFLDVAPCTRVSAFHGRFLALVQDPTRTHDRFAFRFHFQHGAQDVMVQFARAPGGLDGARDDALSQARVFMTVMRKQIAATPPPPILGLDPERGNVRGPSGEIFPLGGEQLAGLLDQLGPEAARRLGREIGRAVGEAARQRSIAAGEPHLEAAPAQLVAGVLDTALAQAGLGRLALDVRALQHNDVAGALLRPPLDVCTRGLVTLYEGLLESALGDALGAPVIARCFDADEPSAIPWRFGVARGSALSRLDRAPGESADDVARRLGLPAS